MLDALVLAAGLALANPAPDPLPLSAAIARARQASPLLDAAARLAEGTRDAARLAGRPLNPLVDLRAENFILTGPAPLPLDVFATISQPIEMWGKRGFRRGIADADRDIAAAALSSAHRHVTTRTVEFYLQALKARAVVGSLRAHREGLVTLIAAMRRRVEEGHAAEADLLKFETEDARLEIDLAHAEVDLARSLGSLSFIVGATDPIHGDQLVDSAGASVPAVDAAEIMRRVEDHPDAVSAAARVTRAQQAASYERARWLPDPLLTGGYKRTAGVDTGVANITLTLPLFDRNKSGAARALGEERAALADRDQVIRRLAQEATTLINVAQTLAARSERTARTLLAPAEIVRSAARARFREGVVDVISLIDAERVYSNVHQVAVALHIEAALAALQSRLALGEDIQP